LQRLQIVLKLAAWEEDKKMLLKPRRVASARLVAQLANAAGCAAGWTAGSGSKMTCLRKTLHRKLSTLAPVAKPAPLKVRSPREDTKKKKTAYEVLVLGSDHVPESRKE